MDLNEVDRWLEDPALLYRIRQLNADIVNEDDNILYGLLALFAKQSLEIQGKSSAGKNTIAEGILRLLPPEWWEKITGLSDKSLRYLESGKRILYVVERKGLRGGDKKDESTTEYDMKVCISEGSIDILVTERRPKKGQEGHGDEREFTTKKYTVKINSFMMTSTDFDVPEELENRLHIEKARDDVNQNRLVRDRTLGDAEKFPWDLPRTDFTLVRMAIQKAEAEAPEHVVIPYATSLATILNENETRVRRDTKKLLSLIKAVARLNYRNRPIKESESTRVLISMPEDFWMLYQIARGILAQTFTGLTDAHIAFWKACLEAASENDGDITVKKMVEKARLRGLNQKSEGSVRNMIDVLTRKGILVKDEERKEGKRHIWMAVEKEPILPHLAARGAINYLDLRERFNSWLDANRIPLPEAYAPGVCVHPLTGETVSIYAPEIGMREETEQKSGFDLTNSPEFPHGAVDRGKLSP
jgi:hypothetical protein